MLENGNCGSSDIPLGFGGEYVTNLFITVFLLYSEYSFLSIRMNFSLDSILEKFRLLSCDIIVVDAAVDAADALFPLL